MFRKVAAPVVVMFLLAACGGSSTKGAVTAPSGATSQLSITTSDASGKSTKFDISGPTYGVFDDASRAFHVFVVDGSTGPAPDCDHLKDLAKTGTKARVADLWIGKNVTAPGKVDAAGALAVDATSGTPQIAMGDTGGLALDFKSIDAKSFDAQIVSASGSASGSLHGTVCDAAKFAAEGTENAQAMPPPPPPPADAPTYSVKIGDAVANVNAADATKTLARFDPSSKTLVLASWPYALSPSCSMLASPEKSFETNGVVIATYVQKVTPKKLGKYAVTLAQSTSFGPQAAPPASASIHGTLDVKRFEDDIIVGDFDSENGDVKGHITAAICPAGKVDLPAPAAKEKAKPSKSSGKKTK